jgi:hypothetical protein
MNRRLGSATAVREHGSASPSIHGPSYQPGSTSSRESSAELQHRLHPNYLGAQHVNRSPLETIQPMEEHISPMSPTDSSPAVGNQDRNIFSPETQAMTDVMESQQPSPETLQAIFQEKEEQTQITAYWEEQEYFDPNEESIWVDDSSSSQTKKDESDRKKMAMPRKQDELDETNMPPQNGEDKKELFHSTSVDLEQEPTGEDHDSSDDDSVDVAIKIAEIKRKRAAKKAAKTKKVKTTKESTVQDSGKFICLLRSIAKVSVCCA